MKKIIFSILIILYASIAWGRMSPVVIASNSTNGSVTNLLTNGDFSGWSGDNPTGWTVTGESGTSYVTESSGAVRFYWLLGDPTLSMSQSGITTKAVVYNYSIDIVSRTSGQIKIGGAVASEASIPTTVGTHTGKITATAGGNITIYRVNGATVDLVFDNFILTQAP